MAIDRSIWVEVFERDQFPTFPCPRCERGRVALDKETLKIVEPTFSTRAHDLEGWEPDWTRERFSVHLRCVESECGEVVVVSGDTKNVDKHDEEFGWTLTSALTPRTMFPPPPIISLPTDLPHNISSKIEAAFGLFWLDFGASGNSLRISVELLMNHLNVPHTAISKKTGKLVDLDLNGRIQFYEKSSPDHGQTFHALRVVGNIGSHDASLSREALLDAFELYEDALAEIVGGRKAYLEALKKKILATKGKY
jgi:hypothetical protein